MPFYQDQVTIFSEIYVNRRIYFYRTFGVYMYYFVAAKETSTVKLPAFFQKNQSEERVLRVKALKLFRILVMLWDISATFWDMARFINH